jgi:hypothetical protein
MSVTVAVSVPVKYGSLSAAEVTPARAVSVLSAGWYVPPRTATWLTVTITLGVAGCGEDAA